MDPLPATAEQWSQLARAVGHLAVFLGLMINTALAFMLAHAVIPSLVNSGDAPPDAGRFRRVLYPLSALSLALTLYAFARVVAIGVPVLQHVYDRFVI